MLPFIKDGLSVAEFAFACGYASGACAERLNLNRQISEWYSQCSEDAKPFILKALEALDLQTLIEPNTPWSELANFDGYPHEEVEAFIAEAKL